MRSEAPGSIPAANVAAPAATMSMAAVNGWRGPGALAIAIGHFGVATDFFTVRHLEPLVLLVDFFFVLSGLLIAQVYGDRLGNASAIPEYIVRRFGRIWPVQAATLAILVCYELAKLLLRTFADKSFSSVPFDPNGINPVGAIWTNLTLIHSLGVHDHETWNFPSWSVSVEFATYIVFALYCLLAPLIRHVAAAATIVASIAILVLVAPYHMRSTFDYGIFRCFAGFFAGTLCYELLRRIELPHWPAPTLVEIAAAILLVTWMAYASGTYAAYAAPLVLCLFVVPFVAGRGRLSRVLLAGPMQFLAKLSFTIYMVHAVVLIFLFAFLHGYERASGSHLFFAVPNPLAGRPGAVATVQVFHIAGTFAKWALGAFYVGAVLIASLVTYWCVELPGRAFFARLAKRFPASPRSAVASPADLIAEPAEPAT